MDDNKQLPALQHDFTMKDLEVIEKFKEDGMLGLHTLKDTDVERCMALYMDGQTYRDIARVTQIKKDVILFLSHKLKWWELRRDYLEELHATLKEKVIESKLLDQKFLLHLSLAYRKKIGKNVDKYLKTDDPSFSDKIDQKDIATYLKIAGILHNLTSEDLGNNGTDKSLVGLNGLGEGVTITKTGANSVEITPKAISGVSSKLKQFAELKREQERASQPAPKKVHDIIVEQTPTPEKEEKENEENE